MLLNLFRNFYKILQDNNNKAVLVHVLTGNTIRKTVSWTIQGQMRKYLGKTLEDMKVSSLQLHTYLEKTKKNIEAKI